MCVSGLIWCGVPGPFFRKRVRSGTLVVALRGFAQFGFGWWWGRLVKVGVDLLSFLCVFHALDWAHSLSELWRSQWREHEDESVL